MKLIDLHWSNSKEEGLVKYTKAFDEAPVVLQLDVLHDCIIDLQEKYEECCSQLMLVKNK
jgi:hypothetical protein